MVSLRVTLLRSFSRRLLAALVPLPLSDHFAQAQEKKTWIPSRLLLHSDMTTCHACAACIVAVCRVFHSNDASCSDAWSLHRLQVWNSPAAEPFSVRSASYDGVKSVTAYYSEWPTFLQRSLVHRHNRFVGELRQTPTHEGAQRSSALVRTRDQAPRSLLGWPLTGGSLRMRVRVACHGCGPGLPARVTGQGYRPGLRIRVTDLG